MKLYAIQRLVKHCNTGHLIEQWFDEDKQEEHERWNTELTTNKSYLNFDCCKDVLALKIRADEIKENLQIVEITPTV